VVVAVGGGVGVGAVVEVDDIEDGDAALAEGDVVVAEAGKVVLVDVGGVAGVFGGDFEHVAQPRGGHLVEVDVEVLVGAHVGDDEGFDLVQGAVVGPLGGEVAGAVEGVGVGPLFDGFFAVVEQEPDGVALGRMGAEDGADLDEQSSGGGAVVGSVEVDVAEGVVGLVVSGENDDAVFFAGESDDVIAHRLEAGGGAGGEGVGFEVALGGFWGEVLLDELFSFGVAGRAVEALGGDVEELLGEVVGGLSAELGGGLLGVDVGGRQEKEQ